jgi:hypothetical protein
MNRVFLLGPCVAALAVALLTQTCHAAEPSPLLVEIHGPSQPLKMGDTPTFTGKVTNRGDRKLNGLIVYLSLVSLKPGEEQPVDLEDWSAQKAVRIAELRPGHSNSQQWPMRLIVAGKFGVALTVVDPNESQPIISDLLTFDVESKPTLSSGRIVPVALGEPALLVLLIGLYWVRTQFRRS